METGMKFVSQTLALCVLLAPLLSPAQSEFSAPKPSVQVVAAESATLIKGKPASVTLKFRVASGFHINSNHPNSELLIPTVLKLSPPTDLSVGNIQYPAGEELAFAFSPDEKLSVYTGDFSVQATARTVGAIHAGSYRVHGELKYQACDNSACYPPKSIPVNFDVHVQNAPKPPRHNPAQSPDVHN
jgi:DsbC/DsbD-like thiol-disulfide interchange protein